MGMAVESQFHVLAVDDNLVDRKVIERLLKKSSYQVTTVDSGSKALEFLGLHEDDSTNRNQPSVSPNSNQELEVNLIITDYCMPGMTGYDLLKKIKESSSLKNIPVVIMSSENVPARITRCLEEGAEEFFVKPVRPADLNKLKPHMMKTKLKDIQSPQEEEVLSKQESADTSEIQSPRSQSENHHHHHPPQPQQQQQQQQSLQSQSQSQSQSNSNKRKSRDEGLSPDRTRPRYSGLTVV